VSIQTVERPVHVPQIVDQVVDVPVHQQVQVQQVVDVPVDVPVERHIPVPRQVEVYVDVPVQVPVEQTIQIPREVPVSVPRAVPVHVVEDRHVEVQQPMYQVQQPISMPMSMAGYGGFGATNLSASQQLGSLSMAQPTAFGGYGGLATQPTGFGQFGAQGGNLFGHF